MVMHKTSNFVVRTVYDKNMLSQSKELGSMTFSVSQRVYLPTFLNFFEGVNNSRLGQKCKLGTVA